MAELLLAGRFADGDFDDAVEAADATDVAAVARARFRLADHANAEIRRVVASTLPLYRRRARGLPDGTALAAWHLMNGMLDIAPQRAEEFLHAVLARVAGDVAAESEVRDRSALARLVAERGTVGELHTKNLQ